MHTAFPVPVTVRYPLFVRGGIALALMGLTRLAVSGSSHRASVTATDARPTASPFPAGRWGPFLMSGPQRRCL
ncbi:hypothetical protein Misp01_42910 [Microtetraspora sp. NBRC 13810]|nr:hypothetical protein Misp01_42910 [Microtetraspora sp. NBRC 13810]